MCTFLVGLLCLDHSWLCPCAPPDLCCSQRWLSTIMSAPHLSILLLLTFRQWAGLVQDMGQKERFLWGTSFQINIKHLWPPSPKMPFVSHFPIPGKLLKAAIFIASPLPVIFPACIYWYTCDSHRNRRSSDAAADSGPFEMFPGSFFYLYNLASLLQKATTKQLVQPHETEHISLSSLGLYCILSFDEH